MRISRVDPDAYDTSARSFIAAMDILLKAKTVSKERIESAQRIADEYKTAGTKFIVTDYEGVAGVVGLMILSDNKDEKCFKVEDVCTHPCTKGVGLALIQHAVNFSSDFGYMGKLMLTDMSGGNFYDRLGFISSDHSIKKILEPTRSEKWTLCEGKGFILKEYSTV
ncbi:GNAT family N-acetyltransferase [Citrobacter farmeri]|uniref:N-acetyltransferase domain-containing protein n=1 Tax=Citrobacter amalonaticus Y19 TaxID=1261127 RepID=A0A0F6TX13_CITAM|nr:GNAT family N-acetyltransferase [Citrobacter amalonaticus]AKE60027.1 hypothetical protein F384_16400 [Citrobacter amalonaticus Y19]EKV5653086.1 GNAT family N-acetyltransferase [Citrobacter farmeri]